jgi:hypothetical protein
MPVERTVRRRAKKEIVFTSQPTLSWNRKSKRTNSPATNVENVVHVMVSRWAIRRTRVSTPRFGANWSVSSLADMLLFAMERA